MMRLVHIYALFLTLLVSSPIVLAKPNFPAPPDAQVASVAENMIYNSMPMSVRKFSSKDSAEKILAFYRKLWRAPVAPGFPGFKEEELDNWKVITRPEDGYMMSVQVKPGLGKGSIGLLGLGKLDAVDGKVTLGKGFPKLADSRVVNDIAHHDAFKKGRTIMLQNKFSLTSNVQYYRDHYGSRGWNPVLDSTSVPGYMHTFIFRKGNNEVSLTVARTKSGSQVVANMVE